MDQGLWKTFGESLPVGFLLQDGRQHVGDGFTPELLLAGEHFGQHHTERPDIGSPIGQLAGGLLGAHVARRAHDESRLGGGGGERRRVGQITLVALFFQRLGQPEIQHLDLSVGCDLDVRRFQVPMNDALLVCGLERFGNLQGDR